MNLDDFSIGLFLLMSSPIPLPAAVFDVQPEAVDSGEGGEKVLQDADRVLFG